MRTGPRRARRRWVKLWVAAALPFASWISAGADAEWCPPQSAASEEARYAEGLWLASGPALWSSQGRPERQSDAGAEIPVIGGLFPKEQKLPAGFARELQKLVGHMRVVRDNDSALRQLRRNDAVLPPLIFGRMVAVVDEDVDRNVERGQRLD